MIETAAARSGVSMQALPSSGTASSNHTGPALARSMLPTCNLNGTWRPAIWHALPQANELAIEIRELFGAVDVAQRSG